jgi:mannose-6-phosphate isomerase-like protein (cupin superfamily)
MKVLDLGEELKRAKTATAQIAYRRVIEAHTFEAGVARFSPEDAADPEQVTHQEKDVLCYILNGRGRLRAVGHETPLRPGLLCHIPAGTPHDFAATTEPLTLYYCLIRTRPS